MNNDNFEVGPGSLQKSLYNDTYYQNIDDEEDDQSLL